MSVQIVVSGGYGDEMGLWRAVIILVMLSVRGMPRKIGFIVVSSSGHEDNFSAKELMVHAPTVNGWRSTRFCSYPQQITLQLIERSWVRKLQLLAHQYLISAKVELHIGDSLPDPAQFPGLPGQLHRLGYVSLSDNEKTGYTARELKSVHVNAIGTYLRLTLHRNHSNCYNHYNQVALVAINVLGDSLDGNALNTIPSREQLIEQYLNGSQLETALDGTHLGCDSIPPLDDLAFDMYQDPEVARIIRQLDRRRQDVVRQERYELAKTLKQAIADLHKVGERLGRYDVEKHRAIEQEDHDLARKKKQQMDEYRIRVYQQLESHDLLNMAAVQDLLDLATVQPAIPVSVETSPSKEPPSQKTSPGAQRGGRPAGQQPSSKPRALTQTLKKGRKSHTLPKGRGESERVATGPRCVSLVPNQDEQDVSCLHSDVPRIDVTSTPHKERPLPELRRKDRPREVSCPLPAGEHSYSPESHPSPSSPGGPAEPEPMSENTQREASLPIEVFGEGLVAGAFSRNWSHRERALLAVCDKLLEASPGAPKEEQRNLTRATVFLVKKALPDKVSSVFQAALKVLRLLLSQQIPRLGIGRAEVSHCLEQTWPDLLARSGDPAGRLRAITAAYIQEMALWKEVRALQVIPSELTKPLKTNLPTRLALSRAELLERLLPELGTHHSGFTLANVMKFCTGALEHSASEVREVAVRIMLSVYQENRAAVLKHLPANDAATRKSVLFKRLFEAFASMDSRLIETQMLKNDAGLEDGEREKEEIRSLQEQLAALKEISEKDKDDTAGQTQAREAHEVHKEAAKVDKTEATEAHQSKLSDATDEQHSGVSDLDNLCIFCGKKDESFTEDGLDLHYWKHCPMLRRCDECRQVVEIASLTEHLLGECESRDRFSQCPRCSEALPTQQLANHAQGPSCNPPASGNDSNHCPLCHNNFIPGEEAWKAHLIGRDGCKQNSRRTVGSQRTQPIQVKAADGETRLRQTWSEGARSKVVGRTSRIPALASRANRTQTGRPAQNKP